ncbi:MAG: hypothetical protein AAF656_00485 [Planctomycetota bacterium]
MMFGTFAQKDFFEYPQVGTYAGVVINANMAAHAPAGLASFLLGRTKECSYILDPLTHAFQHDPSAVSGPGGETKKSIRTLADIYGPPADDCVGMRPLRPQDFDDQAEREGFVARCLHFQKTHLVNYMQEDGAAKYLEDDDIKEPAHLVAPYFFMSETTCSKWLPVNEQLAARAVDQEAGSASVVAAVVISKGLLQRDDLVEQVVAAVKRTGVSGVLIWVDSFDEVAATTSELRAFLGMCRSFRDAELSHVINLHGGYFSLLAGSTAGGNALTGVTHGPEFGEHRGVVPVGGGIPIARYYVPQLHSRIRYRDCLRMFQQKDWLASAKAFHENVCGCDVCKKVLNGDASNFTEFGASITKSVRRRNGLVRIDFPTKEAQQICLKHYLQRKHREFHAANEAGSEVLLRDLQKGIDQFEDVAGDDGVAHLRKWHDIFSARNTT